MKKQGGTLAALAAALCGMLPTLYTANILLFSMTLVSVVVLSFSAIVLILNDKFSGSLWNWLIKRAYSIEIEYAAAGLGLVGSGLNLFQPGWIWVGIIFILIGAALIGSQIGKGISMMINASVRKSQTNRRGIKQ